MANLISKMKRMAKSKGSAPVLKTPFKGGMDSGGAFTRAPYPAKVGKTSSAGVGFEGNMSQKERMYRKEQFK